MSAASSGTEEMSMDQLLGGYEDDLGIDPAEDISEDDGAKIASEVNLIK